MKLGIIRCMQTEDYCPGTTDFRMVKEHKGVFEGIADLSDTQKCSDFSIKTGKIKHFRQEKIQKSRPPKKPGLWKGRTKKMPTFSSAFGGISPVRQEQYHPEAKTISPVRRWPYHSNGED